MVMWQGSNQWDPVEEMSAGVHKPSLRPGTFSAHLFPSLFQYHHLEGNASLNHEVEHYLLGMMELWVRRCLIPEESKKKG